MQKKPVRKDVLLILAVLAVAAALFAVSRLTPQRGIEGREAQETLAPDAVEYLDATPAPEVTGAPETAAPTETASAPEAMAEPEATAEPEAAAEPEATGAPEETAAPETADSPEGAFVGPMPAPQTEQTRGYVVLTVNGRQYGDPIAMDRDKIITIRQEDGKVNRVHITPESVYMESSTCENQDCVQQGTVTLDNLDTRILGGFVICLPNAVTVELVPEK